MPTMIEQIEEIVEKTAKWPDETVTMLIDRLSRARYPEEDEELSEEWKTTLDRRYEEIKSGRVKMIPGEEVSAEIRKILGR
jgi:putative addiction module component (TIGR02574 family)